jgi:hypothetical protein
MRFTTRRRNKNRDPAGAQPCLFPEEFGREKEGILPGSFFCGIRQVRAKRKGGAESWHLRLLAGPAQPENSTHPSGGAVSVVHKIRQNFRCFDTTYYVKNAIKS